MSPKMTRSFEYFVRTVWVGTFVFIGVKAMVSPNKHSVYPAYSEAAREWVSAGKFSSLVSYQYLPYFSDLMSPFACLPDWLGAASWALLAFTAYATGLRAFLTVFPPDGAREGPGRQLALLCGLCVGCGSFGNHQANVLIVGCWLWAVVAVRGRRWWWAAVLFALPMFKLHTLAPGLVFAALYPRQLGGRLVAVVAGLLLLPFLLHSVPAVLYRLDSMFVYLTSGRHYQSFRYQTLYEACQLYIGPTSAAWVLLVQAVAGLAILFLLTALRRSGETDEDIELHGFLLTSVWCVSFGPSIEPHTYLLAAPALGWWMSRYAFGPKPSLAAVVGIAVVIALSGSLVFSFGNAVRDSLAHFQLPFLAMAAFYVGLLWIQQSRIPNPASGQFQRWIGSKSRAFQTFAIAGNSAKRSYV